jgi:DNA polymerase-3 subunit beta
MIQFSCNASDFSDGLKLAMKAQRSHTVLPILECVLIDSVGVDSIRLTATDLEKIIRVTVPANVQEFGSAAIPTKLLAEFLEVTRKGRVDFTMKKNMAYLRVGGHDVRIKCYDTQEFPDVSHDSHTSTITLPAKQLAALLSYPLSSVDRNTKAAARPALLGVNFDLAGGKLTCAGADGFRLGVADVEASGDDFSCIIPAESLNKLALDKGGDVTINFSSRMVEFVAEAMTLYSQTIEAKYPQYQAIVPQAYATFVRMPVEELSTALRVASLFARVDGPAKCGAIRLSALAGNDALPPRMVISVQSDDLGDYETEVTVSEMGGPQIDLYVNARYLRDAISVIETAEVQMEFSTPAKPIVLRPVGEVNALHVILPIVPDRVRVVDSGGRAEKG